MMNIETLKSQIDLEALIEDDLVPSHKDKWHCPFHDEHTPSFSIKNNRFKCFGCGVSGDIFDYLMKRHNIGLKEAQKMLTGNIDDIPKKPRSEIKKDTLDSPPSELWQTKAKRIIEITENCLWSEQGQGARKWLNNRGLKDETLKLWRIGYNPKDQEIDGLWVKSGIAIPCVVKDTIWYIKIRRAQGKPKYICVSGSKTGASFGAHCLQSHSIGILTEGEFDQMLLHQECGDLIGSATLGGTSGRITDRWIKYLLPLSRIFDAHDTDPAGEDAANDFLNKSERIKRIKPPDGKDITDFWKSGGDLRSWISFELARERMYSQDELKNKSHPQEIKITQYQDLALPNGDPDFSKANLVIKFHSDLLNEDFFLVSNSKLKAKVEAENLGTVVYLPGEIEHLAGLKPEELKKLHYMRKVFGGEFIARNPVSESIFNKPAGR